MQNIEHTCVNHTINTAKAHCSGNLVKYTSFPPSRFFGSTDCEVVVLKLASVTWWLVMKPAMLVEEALVKSHKEPRLEAPVLVRPLSPGTQ